MNQQDRQAKQLAALQQSWQTVFDTLSALRNSRDLENRVEEQLRLDALIQQKEADLAALEAQIQSLESHPQPASSPQHFTGRAKLLFTQRLAGDWRALADLLEIPAGQQRRFSPGDEARDIWAWLDVRNRLNELPVALRNIGRDDLVDVLGGASRDSLPPGSPPEGSPPEGSPPEGSPPEGSPPEGSPPEGSPPEESPPGESPPEESPPEESPTQYTNKRFFTVGCVLSIFVAGLVIWAFALRTLTPDQRMLMRVLISLLSGFAAGSFVGAFTVKAQGLIPGVVATATGGFGVWLLTAFAMFPVAPRFDVVVQPHRSASVLDTFNQGTVSLQVGEQLKRRSINEDGQAWFLDIAGEFRGERVPVGVQIPGFRMEDLDQEIELQQGEALRVPMISVSP